MQTAHFIMVCSRFPRKCHRVVTGNFKPPLRWPFVCSPVTKPIKTGLYRWIAICGVGDRTARPRLGVLVSHGDVGFADGRLQLLGQCRPSIVPPGPRVPSNFRSQPDRRIINASSDLWRELPGRFIFVTKSPENPCIVILRTRHSSRMRGRTREGSSPMHRSRRLDVFRLTFVSANHLERS